MKFLFACIENSENKTSEQKKSEEVTENSGSQILQFIAAISGN